MVSLKDIDDAFRWTDGFVHYYDRSSDKVVFLSEYDHFPEEDTLREEIEESESDRFVRIEAYDNIGYSAMVAFVESQPEGVARDRMERAIHGRGAFRRFRREVERAGSEGQWFEFEAEYFLRRAREWCEDHDVPYVLP